MNKVLGKKVLNQLSPYKQGMQIQEVKEKYQLSRIVKLASNENPYGFSPNVQETLEDMSKDFQLYPDGYAAQLRFALAEKLSVTPDQLVFGSGSDELLTLISRAFLGEGTNTVMATPTFPQYRHHSLIEDAFVKEIPTKQGAHDLDGMLKAIDEDTKVVWLCTPDNPTGTVISEAAFIRFMEQCPSHTVVVLDEAYVEFMDDELQFDLQRHIAAYPNLIVLRTFSKIYGLAGFRVGYGISNESLATTLNIVRGPFNTTSLSQRIAVSALEDDQFIQETKEKNQQVRAAFEQFLDEIDWNYYPSQTNFLLVETPIDADVAAEYLLKHGFIVRSGNVLGYPFTLRITIGQQEDMAALSSVLKELNEDVKNGAVK